jgi:hypothetical protein
MLAMPPRREEEDWVTPASYHDAVCPSGLDQRAIRFGVVDGFEERFALLIVSKDARHTRQGGKVFLRHGARPDDAN